MHFLTFLLASVFFIGPSLSANTKAFLPNTSCMDYSQQKFNQKFPQIAGNLRRKKVCCMPNTENIIRQMQM